jgi:hypothetical protein
MSQLPSKAILDALQLRHIFGSVMPNKTRSYGGQHVVTPVPTHAAYRPSRGFAAVQLHRFFY